MKNRPAFKAAVLFAVGIRLGGWVETPMEVGIAILAVLSASAFYAYRRGDTRLSRALLAALWIAVGALRLHQAVRTDPFFGIERFIGFQGPILLRGVLARDPVQKPARSEWLLECRSITCPSADTMAVRGRVLVPMNGPPPISAVHGDEIEARGRLVCPQAARNPGAFDHREWLARQGVGALFEIDRPDSIRIVARGRGGWFRRQAVYPVRRFILSTLDSLSGGGEQRALFRSLVLGDQGLVTADLREGFSKTGIVHILSVSGSHVAFVYLILSTVFGLFRLPGPAGAGLTAAGLAFYALLAESSPPVIRATLMALTFTFGEVMERRTDAFNAVGVAGLAVLMARPQDLFDIGFQLSFLSVLSLVGIYPRLGEWPPVSRFLRKKSLPRMVRTVVTASLVSLSAQAGTLPLTAVYFNWIPLVSIPANLVAVPLTGGIMALSFMSVMAAAVWFPAAAAYGALNRLLAAAFIRATEAVSRLPFACITVPSPGAPVLLAGYLLVLAVVCGSRSPWRKRCILAAVLLADLSVGIRAVRFDPARLTWIQFDVGQGDAALFRMPGGQSLLVDTGGATSVSDCGKRVLVPYLNRNGIRKLDAVILSHAHLDHTGGLGTLIREFPIGTLVLPPDTGAVSMRGILDLARSRGIRVKTARGADMLSCFRFVRVFVFNPSDWGSGTHETGLNERSLVTLICFGRVKWLSTGDAGRVAEEGLMRVPLIQGCQVLKIGHHGSCSATSPEFLRFVRPRIAVLSVGERNRFGHPCEPVVRAVAAEGIGLLRTDRDAAVILETDGSCTRVTPWR